MGRHNVIYTAKTLTDFLDRCEADIQLIRAQRDRIVKNGLESEGWSLAHTAAIEHGQYSMRQMARELSAKIDLHLDIHASVTTTVSSRKRNPRKYRDGK